MQKCKKSSSHRGSKAARFEEGAPFVSGLKSQNHSSPMGLPAPRACVGLTEGKKHVKGRTQSQNLRGALIRHASRLVPEGRRPRCGGFRVVEQPTHFAVSQFQKRANCGREKKARLRLKVRRERNRRVRRAAARATVQIWLSACARPRADDPSTARRTNEGKITF